MIKFIDSKLISPGHIVSVYIKSAKTVFNVVALLSTNNEEIYQVCPDIATANTMLEELVDLIKHPR